MGVNLEESIIYWGVELKVFNLVFLSIGLALVSVQGLCMLGDALLGPSAQYVVLVPALLIGMNARKITEKILGYTLKQAQDEDSHEE